MCPGTTPENALAQLNDLHERLTEQYENLLLGRAPHDISCFVEYMTPDEPPAPHHDWMCENLLMPMMRRDIVRATLSMPPGHAKTKFCSRYFPAFYLGNYPDHRWLQGGHSQDFAEKEFGQVVRDIIDTERYQKVFPEVFLSESSRAAGSWKIANRRGGYVCKGVGQKIAGFRGNGGVGDDLLGSREDAQSPTIREKTNNWLFTDFRTRFLPNSFILLVATRWHPEDVIGFVEGLNKQGRGIPWQIFNLNAIIENEEEMAVDPMGRSIGETLWPSYYGANEILEFKATLPQLDWFALYKGKPTNQQGNIVQLGWYQRYDEVPPPEARRRVTISVDTAEKTTERSKYSVVQCWIETHERKHYLVDSVRDKVEITALIPMIENMATHWGAKAILVEDAGAGTQYIQLRRGKAPAPIIDIKKPANEKGFRFDGVSPMIAGGEVFLPKQAIWLADFENENNEFPHSTYTDQIDAASQYLEWARVRRTYGTKKMKGTSHAK